MGERAPLEILRRRYAAEIMHAVEAKNRRVEETFATIPREDFLTPPPWRIFSPGGLVEKITSDPADLYDDVLVVLDARQGINNGQPSLHAAWIAAVDPQPGETILHIGIGTGYYTAILAVLAGNGGAIHAYEIDAPLAALAKERLAGFPQVRVRATSGVAADPPEAGVIYVNASATAPDAAWLRALRPGGRLIFPWQPGAARGSVALLVTRAASGFRAIPTMAVGFIPCAGAQASPSPGVGDPWETRSVWFAADRSPDESATAVYPDMWFSSMPIEG